MIMILFYYSYAINESIKLRVSLKSKIGISQIDI